MWPAETLPAPSAPRARLQLRCYGSQYGMILARAGAPAAVIGHVGRANLTLAAGLEERVCVCALCPAAALPRSSATLMILPLVRLHSDR